MQKIRFQALFLSILLLLPFCDANAAKNWQQTSQQLQRLEQIHHIHVGVALYHSATNSLFSYRGARRFAMCSTHKVMTAAAVLAAVDNRLTQLDKTIHYKPSNLVSYSPITHLHLDKGMSLRQLLAASLRYSDNTASNLLVHELGGVSAVNQFARQLNDQHFRLDRLEPSLNLREKGDPRDSTTPIAMAKSLSKLLLGQALSKKQRHFLLQLMLKNTTGDHRIRAGLPANWQVADKTGTCGEYGIGNDIAVVWPQQRPGYTLAIYTERFERQMPAIDAVIADVARITSFLH